MELIDSKGIPTTLKHGIQSGDFDEYSNVSGLA
jgi:hypothetical protein